MGLSREFEPSWVWGLTLIFEGAGSRILETAGGCEPRRERHRRTPSYSMTFSRIDSRDCGTGRTSANRMRRGSPSVWPDRPAGSARIVGSGLAGEIAGAAREDRRPTQSDCFPLTTDQTPTIPTQLNQFDTQSVLILATQTVVNKIHNLHSY